MTGRLCCSLLLCVGLASTGLAQSLPPPRAPTIVAVQPPAAEDGVLPAPRVLDPTGDAGVDQPLELVEFRDLPLVDAMRLLSQQSGLRIVPSAQAGRTSVNLYLRDVSALTAVAAVSQANGLIYRRDPATGIVRIYTSRENQRDLTDFREDHTEVYTLLYPNALNVATAIRDLYGNRVQLSYGNNDSRTYDDLQERFDRFDLILSRSLGLGFLNSTGFSGFGVSGLGGVGGVSGFSGVSSFGGLGGLGRGSRGGGLSGGIRGSDFLRDTRLQEQQEQQQQRAIPPDQRLQSLTPEEIQALENAFTNQQQPDRSVLLELLRRRPATIYVTVIRQHNQLMVRTSDAQTMTQIHDLVCRLDVPTPVVLLEVKVLSIDLRDNFNSLFDYQFTNGVLGAGGFSPAAPTNGFNSGNILPPFADQFVPENRRFDTIAPGPLGTPPASNLLFQVVSANFRARMQLLEDKNRVTELATPLLMTANNEVSQIFTGQQQPITVGFTPAQTLANVTGVASVVNGTPITTLQNIGTTLLITPNINADRTVTLRIMEENSRVIPNGGQIPLPNANGVGFTQVPVDVVDRRNFTGTVVAKDGMTVAVGGLIQEELDDNRAEVPVLGKVPILGFFFRQQSTTRFRRELVLLIRPMVLTTPTESTEASKALTESLSIHPNVIKKDLSTLGTYTPPEVLRPHPPESFLQNIFRVHTINPKDF